VRPSVRDRRGGAPRDSEEDGALTFDRAKERAADFMWKIGPYLQ
jgi:hypothetical protein